MHLGIYGKKIGMTQVFDENGAAVPITVLDTSGCYVTQKKTKANDGYTALQVAYSTKKPQNVKKPEAGHFGKAKVPAQYHLSEMRFSGDDAIAAVNPGQTLKAETFAKGDRVDVIGVSKGTGFTGVMKRFNFRGKHATHGTSKYFRHGGSNGSNTFPGRVWKNKGMPGHSGDARVTVSNLVIVDVKPEENLLFVRGAVPGAKNAYVLVRNSKRAKAPGEDRKLVVA